MTSSCAETIDIKPLNRLLQNIPVPTGESTLTSTRDYDGERFFNRISEEANTFEPVLESVAEVVSRLWQPIKEIVTTGSNILATYPPRGYSISDVIVQIVENCSVDGASESRRIPVEFVSSQYTFTEEDLLFCYNNGTLRYLPGVIGLIDNSFPTIQKFSLEREVDPEFYDEWLTLEITLQGEVDDLLENYNSYVEEFVSIVPWPERDKIRLSYNII